MEFDPLLKMMARPSASLSDIVTVALQCPKFCAAVWPADYSSEDQEQTGQALADQIRQIVRFYLWVGAEPFAHILYRFQDSMKQLSTTITPVLLREVYDKETSSSPPPVLYVVLVDWIADFWVESVISTSKSSNPTLSALTRAIELSKRTKADISNVPHPS
jgi:hypothetical protein